MPFFFPDVRNAAVVRAMNMVPRRAFVPPPYQAEAEDDRPLPIDCGQTISQPYIVAVMTALLGLHPGDKVLEIGTGSGYQAAILAELEGVTVYSVEIIPALARAAAKRLQTLGYGRIHLRQGDGYAGWPEHAPYQGIIVTAAVEQVPPALAQQLAEGGRLVIPLGAAGAYQVLWEFVKQGGKLEGRAWGGVAFVPFTRTPDAAD